MFPKTGRNICGLRLYLRDFDDSLEAVARLIRKGVGATTTFTDVQQLASVTSAGGDGTMQAFATTAITNPLIAVGSFYLVEVELPFGNNMQFLGVRIVHRPTC